MTGPIMQTLIRSVLNDAGHTAVEVDSVATYFSIMHRLDAIVLENRVSGAHTVVRDADRPFVIFVGVDDPIENGTSMVIADPETVTDALGECVRHMCDTNAPAHWPGRIVRLESQPMPLPSMQRRRPNPPDAPDTDRSAGSP